MFSDIAKKRENSERLRAFCKLFVDLSEGNNDVDGLLVENLDIFVDKELITRHMALKRDLLKFCRAFLNHQGKRHIQVLDVMKNRLAVGDMDAAKITPELFQHDMEDTEMQNKYNEYVARADRDYNRLEADKKYTPQFPCSGRDKLLVKYHHQQEGIIDTYWDLIEKRDTKRLGALIDAYCVDMRVTKRDGRNGLHYAILKKWGDLAKFFIKKMAKKDPKMLDIPTSGQYKHFPLHEAVEAGLEEIVDELIKHGANIYISNSRQYTPLMTAIFWEQKSLVTKLLNLYTPEQIIEEQSNGTNAITAAMRVSRENIKDILEEVCNHVPKKLLKRVIDNVHRDETPFMDALACGRLDAAKVLIENGADPYKTNQYNQTALIWAAYHSEPEAVKWLVNEFNMDVNAVDSFGDTPLTSVSKLELFKGSGNWNHLKFASEEGGHHAATAKFLIEKGADPTWKNKDGQTAIEIAIDNGIKEIIKFWKKQKLPVPDGVDINRALEKINSSSSRSISNTSTSPASHSTSSSSISSNSSHGGGYRQPSYHTFVKARVAQLKAEKKKQTGEKRMEQVLKEWKKLQASSSKKKI